MRTCQYRLQSEKGVVEFMPPLNETKQIVLDCLQEIVKNTQVTILHMTICIYRSFLTRYPENWMLYKPLNTLHVYSFDILLHSFASYFFRIFQELKENYFLKWLTTPIYTFCP